MYRETIADHFPDSMTIILGNEKLEYKKRQWTVEGKKSGLRYGDNPGQEAALYEFTSGNIAIGGCEYVNHEDGIISNISEKELMETGKHLSKSNLTDLDAALNILKYFDEPTAIIMKHSNPSGVASRESITEAYKVANSADRIAAFGGVVVLNRQTERETAEEICKNFVEVVAAPSFEKEALDILSQKKNMRLITITKLTQLQQYRKKRYLEFKGLIDGGIILQQSADNELKKEELLPAETEYDGKIHSIKRKPTEAELEDMLFAWKVVQGVISNSMVFAKNNATVAIGTGEQDRVGATELAIVKAYKKFSDELCYSRHGVPLWELKDKEKIAEIEREAAEKKANLIGSVLASDGFLPFRDTIDVAIKQGIAGVIQPGGSTRDWQSIDACNEYNITMSFTGKRVFRH